MIPIISKIAAALEDGGISTLLQRSFNYIHLALRPYLPKKYHYRNKVKFEGRILDRYNSSIYTDRGGRIHKKEYIKTIKESITIGDDVVVIGGGYGTSSVPASKQCGNGQVTIFEPGSEQVEEIKEVMAINGCKNYNIIQGVFYDDRNVWSESSNAKKLNASDIPKCDVLEMDCEGAEQKICENLEIKPREIIVEVHNDLGSSSEGIKKILKQKNYELESRKGKKGKNEVLRFRSKNKVQR